VTGSHSTREASQGRLEGGRGGGGRERKSSGRTAKGQGGSPAIVSHYARWDKHTTRGTTKKGRDWKPKITCFTALMCVIDMRTDLAKTLIAETSY